MGQENRIPHIKNAQSEIRKTDKPIRVAFTPTAFMDAVFKDKEVVGKTAHHNGSETPDEAIAADIHAAQLLIDPAFFDRTKQVFEDMFSDQNEALYRTFIATGNVLARRANRRSIPACYSSDIASNPTVFLAFAKKHVMIYAAAVWYSTRQDQRA